MGKRERGSTGNNLTPAAGVIVVPAKDQTVVPPHEAPIIEADPPQSGPEPARPESEPKRGFLDQLADGFRRVPPHPFAYYHVAL